MLNSRRRGRWLVALAAVIGGAWFLTLTLPLLTQLGEATLPRLLELVSAGLVFSAGLRPFVVLIKEILQRLQPFVDAIERARKSEVARLEETKQTIVEDLTQKKQAADAASVEVDRLVGEIDNLRADQRMSNWLQQRRDSTDYSRYLGVVSRTREDFEQLTIYLKAVKEEAEAAASADQGAQLLPRVDRIVLYIDDLDRCPERTVEEVIQAVHLLLAFDLFVVVVGVDPRWLLQSLRRRSPVFQASQTGADALTPEERRHWLSTPLSYLEKIFQVPFTLRPLDSGGYQGLIEDLAKPVRPSSNGASTAITPPDGQTANAQPVDTTTQGNDPTRPSVAGEQTRSGNGVVGTDPNVDSQSSPDPGPAIVPRNQNPAYLELRGWEREFMKELFPLIPSPRATKRFVNVYRLLKALSERSEPEAFRGEPNRGTHRVVLLLLAMQTGYPAEAAHIFHSLIELVDSSKHWWQFIDELTPLGAGQAEANASDDATPNWQEMKEKLTKVRKLIAEDQSCVDFKTWASVVARFSFYSGQAVLTP
jgi:hypothetical protein